MGLKNGTVKLEKPNSNWIKMYDDEKAHLQEVFGDLAIDIQHIGSTAIKNISAKPIIDIAVGIRSLEDFCKVKKYFLNDPYSIKENPVEGEELVLKGYPETSYLIHVMEVNSKRYKDTIIFRDFMNKNGTISLEYEKLKKELAKKYPNERKKYTEAKNEFIKKVLEIAYKELEK